MNTENQDITAYLKSKYTYCQISISLFEGLHIQITQSSKIVSIQMFSPGFSLYLRQDKTILCY